MTYYSVLEVTPTQQGWIPDYAAAVIAIVASYGGQYLARTSDHERLEGHGDTPASRVIIAWPNKKAALDFINSPEYAPHLAARTAGSISHHFLLPGLDE